MLTGRRKRNTIAYARTGTAEQVSSVLLATIILQLSHKRKADIVVE